MSAPQILLKFLDTVKSVLNVSQFRFITLTFNYVSNVKRLTWFHLFSCLFKYASKKKIDADIT